MRKEETPCGHPCMPKKQGKKRKGMDKLLFIVNPCSGREQIRNQLIDILDIFTLYSSPVRVEFFADTVEDIRMFDPNTQKSFKKLDEVIIYPLHKFLINDETKKAFKNKLNDEIKKFGKNETLDILFGEISEKIDNDGYFEGIEVRICGAGVPWESLVPQIFISQ